jgi:hypothetical protein
VRCDELEIKMKMIIMIFNNHLKTKRLATIFFDFLLGYGELAEQLAITVVNAITPLLGEFF